MIVPVRSFSSVKHIPMVKVNDSLSFLAVDGLLRLACGEVGCSPSGLWFWVSRDDMQSVVGSRGAVRRVVNTVLWVLGFLENNW